MYVVDIPFYNLSKHIIPEFHSSFFLIRPQILVAEKGGLEEGGKGSSILSFSEQKSGVVIGNLYDLEVPPSSRSGFAIS